MQNIINYLIQNIEVTIIGGTLIGVAIIFLIALLSGGSKKKARRVQTDDPEVERLLSEIDQVTLKSRDLIQQYELKVRQADDELNYRYRQIASAKQAIYDVLSYFDNENIPKPERAIGKLEKIANREHKGISKAMNRWGMFLVGFGVGVIFCLMIAAFWYAQELQNAATLSFQF